MTDRDRLIELFKGAESKVMEELNKHLELEEKEWMGIYADYLLANGVIIPPCKVGDRYVMDTAKNIFNAWNDVTGAVVNGTSWYYELESVIEDIVKLSFGAGVLYREEADSEIVKALELEVNKKSCIHEEYEEACGLWCKHYHKWCEDMSGKNKKDNCSAFKPTAPTKRAKATLDLINRLQEENENYKALYEGLKAEHIETIKAIKHYKSEAYKECIEKAKSEIDSQSHSRSLEASAERFRIHKILDNLLKEMVGENDG